MTTRRNFLALLIGLAAGVGLPMGRKAEVAMPTNGYPDHLVAGEPSADLVSKVFVNGADVTAECFECHRAQGWARCYITGPDGYFIVDRNPTCARERLIRGNVVVEWKIKPDNFTVRKFVCETDGKRWNRFPTDTLSNA